MRWMENVHPILIFLGFDIYLGYKDYTKQIQNFAVTLRTVQDKVENIGWIDWIFLSATIWKISLI